MGMTPQHFHTIPTSCAILPPLTQICFVFVSCVQRRDNLWKAVGWVVADVRSQNQSDLTKPEDSISYKKFLLRKIITYMHGNDRYLT